MFKIRNILLLAAAAGLLGLIPVLSALAGKPSGDGGGRNAPPGTIYFWGALNGTLELFTMNGDGSAQQPLAGSGLTIADRGAFVPSRALHDGRRWFLAIRPDPATEEDELFAVGTDGAGPVVRQLTTDPDLRVDGRPLWLPGDRGVSWEAVRWDVVDGMPQPVEAGIYTLALTFDADGVPGPAVVGVDAEGSPVDAEPELLVPSDVCLYSAGGARAAMAGHDWRPDAGAVVYRALTDDGSGGVVTDGLTIVPLADPDHPVRLLADDEAGEPYWSPDGALIAYQSHTTINVVAPDGTAQRVLHTYTGKTYTGSIALRGWSPDSQYLLCHQESIGKTNVRDVYRLSLGGVWQNLTAHNDAFATPLGWR